MGSKFSLWPGLPSLGRAGPELWFVSWDGRNAELSDYPLVFGVDDESFYVVGNRTGRGVTLLEPGLIRELDTEKKSTKIKDRRGLIREFEIVENKDNVRWNDTTEELPEEFVGEQIPPCPDRFELIAQK